MASSQDTTNPETSNSLDQQVSLFADRLFLRLKWQFFQPLSNIQVLDFDDAEEPHWTPLFGNAPGQQHVIASEPVTDPHRARLAVVLDPVESWEYWQDAELQNEKPVPLILEGRDGGVITLGQFVTEVHTYVAGLRDLLQEALAADPDGNVEYYFAGCMGPTRNKAAAQEEPRLSVFLVDSEMEDLDEWWENVIGWVRNGQTPGTQ
ncbi:uncharacterized protein F4822DRAFT_114455 [Hypoxylon trugodes]|uniref:uncharacterized protein n=1 Tax=Hypoxylon trugodes TaxID=326681 RepID=UPI0021A068D6|nr:uncharacterized protein F4822DRAFT_114455 [Hypoxylon trugodes]KAI1392049.1 hypothetical protein F4822DRAFT_114455 [Hypoxylon trugodes]